MCLLDIGTGAGFPGIPLKIYYPGLRVVAVEAVSKKVMFLKHLCRVLDLHDVECLNARITPFSFSSDRLLTPRSCDPVLQPKAFHVVVSRAVGTVPLLIEFAHAFLAPGGYLLLQRGRHAKQELVDQAPFLEKNKYQVMKMIEVNFSFLDYPRYLMVLRQSL